MSDLSEESFSKDKWSVIIGLVTAAIMYPIAMNPHWIGTLDLVFGSGMFMLGSLAGVIALGWGLGESVIRAQISVGLSPLIENWMTCWIRFVVPLALAFILFGFIYDTVFNS